MDGIGTILDKVQAWGGMTAMLVVLAAVFLVYLIQCFPRVSDGFFKLGSRRRKERMVRRDRLDAFFAKPVNLSLSSDHELEAFLQKERRLAIIEEFSGIEMSEEYAAAFLKLRATGKVRISRIRKAWMSLEIDEKTGELHSEKSWFFYPTLFIIYVSLGMAFICGILFCLTLVFHKPAYLMLLYLGISLAEIWLLFKLEESEIIARKIEKEVYGKAAKESKPSQPMENAADTADGTPTTRL